MVLTHMKLTFYMSESNSELYSWHPYTHAHNCFAAPPFSPGSALLTKFSLPSGSSFTRAMAEAPDLPKTLEEMEKEITCAVCHEHYREPKILPCLHYYCIECLQRLAEQVGQPVPCPECRRQAPFPLNDARQLPTPFFVHRMIDFYARMETAQGKKEALCESCSGGKAEAFCRQCTEFICSECVKSHEKMKAFKGHEIASMEQLQVGGARKLVEPPTKCKVHDEVVKLYCYTCSQLICRDCLIDDHADHNREFVKKAAPRCREKLRESTAPLRQATAEITAAAADVQAAKREVAENLASVSETIRQSMDKMIATLQQRKQQLLAKASELAEEKLGALDAQEKSLNMSLAEARSLVDVVERSLQNASDEELLEMQLQMASGVEEGCRKRQQQVGLQPAAEANIGTDMTLDQQVLLSVGCVGLDVVDTSKCTVEGADTKAEVNKPAELTLHLVDSTGRSYISLPSIVAEVKSLVDGSVIPTTIFPIGGGTYRAVFTPHVRGRHIVTLRVNGREICGSPFSVFVRVPPAQIKEPVRRIDGVKGPYGVAISKDEEVLVAECDGGVVSVFDKQGRKLRTIQHNDLPHPTGVATDPDGNIYISNRKDTVVKFSRDGQPLQVNKSLGPNLYLSRVISDTLFICSEEHVLLVACEDDLRLIKKFGKKGKGKGEFNEPDQVVSVNGELYITDYNNHRIQIFGQEGLTFVRSFEVKHPSTQQLCKPRGVCVGPDGLLYVVCWYPSCVLVLTLGGEYVASLGAVGGGPGGVAVDADGFVYVTCCLSYKTLVY